MAMPIVRQKIVYYAQLTAQLPMMLASQQKSRGILEAEMG